MIMNAVVSSKAHPEYGQTTIKDRMITDLSDFSRNLMLSIDILPIPTNEAV